jgi:hypothetical protein
MGILLLGDFAIPYWGCINTDSIKRITQKKIVIANLEGPFITNYNVEAFDKYKINLCAEKECVNYLKDLNVNYLSFANNHILDFEQTLQETVSILRGEGIDFFGTAQKPYIELIDANKKICIWGAVSYVTGKTSNKHDKINDFNPIRLFHQVCDYKKYNPGVYLIVYLHWGYEFARFPQPADREWALKAIDNGVNAVIGVHPHEVQGIEKYNNGIIVYSLGNFILPQSDLSRPSLSDDTPGVRSDLLHLPKIGVEIDTFTNEILVHQLYYDKENSELLYEGETNEYEKNSPPFTNFSIEQYRKWYKKQKYKGEQRSRFNIYPTFYSYFRFYNVKFHLTKLYLIVFRLLRQLLISWKLHTPTSYNELTSQKEQNE